MGLTVAAVPNMDRTKWTVASYYYGGAGTNFHHLTPQMKKKDAESLARQIRKLCGLSAPAKGM